MSKEFKEGFSKGIGLTTGVLAIPVARLLLFGFYSIWLGKLKKEKEWQTIILLGKY
tara:strand:+ start:231 stop:398 length:168 start_codon:yes stop_codon:yes gene_type:complete